MLSFRSDLNEGGIAIQNWLENTERIVYGANRNQ
jgi:hypothetical protein